jgi:O-antigen/teichoic acid export membrane protein
MFKSALTRNIKQYIKHPLYKNSSYLIANTVVTTGLGFFFWMVVARFFSTNDVGLGAAIISAITLLSMLSRLGFDATIIRFVPKIKKPEDVINSCFTLAGMIALCLSAVYIVGLGLWSPALAFIADRTALAVVFAFFVLLWTLFCLTDSVFVALRKAKYILLKGTLFSMLKIFLPVLTVIWGAFGITSAWYIAAGLAVACSLFILLPMAHNGYRLAPKLKGSTIAKTWKYSAGSYLAFLFSATPCLILPLLVVNLLGAIDNAHFYVAWTIAGLLLTIPLAVSQSLFAEGSHFEDELAKNTHRALKLIYLLLIPAVVLMFTLGGWFLSLFGESYRTSGLILLWILSLSSLFVGINRVYSTILRVEGRVTQLAVIYGLTFAAVLAGSYFTMPVTGIVGIGYVWLATQAVTTLYVLWVMRLFRQKSLKFRTR